MICYKVPINSDGFNFTLRNIYFNKTQDLFCQVKKKNSILQYLQPSYPSCMNHQRNFTVKLPAYCFSKEMEEKPFHECTYFYTNYPSIDNIQQLLEVMDPIFPHSTGILVSFVLPFQFINITSYIIFFQVTYLCQLFYRIS